MIKSLVLIDEDGQCQHCKTLIGKNLPNNCPKCHHRLGIMLQALKKGTLIPPEMKSKWDPTGNQFQHCPECQGELELGICHECSLDCRSFPPKPYQIR